MRIDGHRLDGDVVHLRSPNHSGRLDAGVPDTIVVHFTALSSAASAVRVLTDPQRKVSAHLVVGRDGAVTQLLDFDHIGWHAGRSQWAGRQELNRCSIGIEIDNAGPLHVRDGRYMTWFEAAVDASQVVEPDDPGPLSRWWHRYPDEQLQAVESLCGTLCAHYPIRHIVGHEQIAPGRKIDPGPAFPLDALRHAALGSR